MTTLRLTESIGRSSSRLALLLIPLVFACLALSPMAQAVSPSPDGDYPGGNTAEGFKALFSLNTQDGGFNTAIGFSSLAANVNGSFNTALGAGALALNTSHNNTAVGAAALLLNTTGDGNTATGAAALLQNTTGRGNTATGGAALSFNTTGSGNTAVGAQALLNSLDADLNTAVGVNALTANTTGRANTAVGGGPGQTNSGLFPAALGSNTTGTNNTAVGGADFGDFGPLGSNTTGTNNTAVGASALELNTMGLNNTAVGKDALIGSTGDNNVALGKGAGSGVTSGSSNTAVGASAGSNVITANNVICIGADVGGADVPNSCFIDSIRGKTTINNDAIPVLIDSAGQLGTASSSRRFKTDIKPIDNTSESILALKPVSFRYKIHKDTTPNFGLIAEDVAKVNPDLVIYDADRKPYTVRYDAVNAMLLNEFLKEHRKNEEQEKTIAELKSGMTVLAATVKEQAAQIQKVSAQLEASKPAPQVVNNP